MEIYTGDFYSTTEKYVEKIVEDIDKREYYYIIGDNVHDCVHNIRKKIYERLSDRFNEICLKHNNIDDLKNDLFKTINEL